MGKFRAQKNNRKKKYCGVIAIFIMASIMGCASATEENYSLQSTYNVRLNHDTDGSTNDTERKDKIEVYEQKDGKGGMLLIHSGESNDPYRIDVNTGWKSIYLYTEEWKDYLFEIQLDIREKDGELSYQVYAFGEQVGPKLAVYSKENESFSYTQSDFMEEDFYRWIESVEGYLEKADLLLSIQDGEVPLELGNGDEYFEETILKLIKESW
ncbi:MAG: hypothetical protein IJO85_03215 [Lachnospiraceae bacterium]|nr:hypothetical protein [Lachnospiraceae bacterium]